MALVKCAECGEQVSDKAFGCPKCGCPHLAGVLAGGRALGFEWKSKTEFFGLPLIHVTLGFDKKTGRLAVSRGIIAIGQFGVGVITFAQFGIGFLFGLGQFMAGLVAVGQFAFGVLFGLGQIATGITAIGQFGLGQYVRAMAGIGQHIWTMRVKDPAAVEYFNRLFEAFRITVG
jgi:hypothetical protein